MVTLRVLRPFRDLVARTDRQEGETFDVSDERAEHIGNVLPGYVEPMPKAQPQVEPDYQSMKVAELRALCSERGVDVPAKATKRQIVELLEG